MFDRVNNKRTERERESAVPPLYFSPSCSRRVVVRPAIYMQIRSKGELPVTKPSRFEFTSSPSPEYPVKEFTKTISLSADPDFRILLLLFHLSLKVT